MKRILLALLLIAVVAQIAWAVVFSFGNTTGTSQQVVEDQIVGSKFTPTLTWTLDSIIVSLRLSSVTGGVTARNRACAIYRVSDSAFIDSTERQSVDTAGHQAQSNVTFTFQGKATVTAGTPYWLYSWGENDVAAGVNVIYYNGSASASDTLFRTNLTYNNAWPATITSWAGRTGSRLACITAYGTVAATGPPNYRHGPAGTAVRHSTAGGSVRHKP